MIGQENITALIDVDVKSFDAAQKTRAPYRNCKKR